MIGFSVLPSKPGLGLGLIGSGLVLMPVVRAVIQRLTGYRMTRPVCISLALLLPIALGLPQIAEDVVAENKAESAKLTAELQTGRSALLADIRRLIDR